MHQLLAHATALNAFAHQQLLHFGAVQAIGFLAQCQLYAGHHLFLVDHGQQYQVAIGQAGLDLVEVMVGLLRIQVGHESDRGTLPDCIEQQLDQALAVVGETLNGDTTQLGSIHRYLLHGSRGR
ncbi:hypothetical protein D3C85_882850 [compost metagenome]